MTLILPVDVTDDDVMHSRVPIFSTYRMKVLERGRVTIPKAIRDSLGISAGHDVDIIVIPVKEGEP
jgi:AbrB family looped-hinge helix DNA binding protein